MPNIKISGTITTVMGTPNPNSYLIKDKDGKTYLVHVGDIVDNEQLLYELYKEDKTVKLEKGDTVEFQPDTHDHAIHVKKVA